jgi:hypothetical protein
MALVAILPPIPGLEWDETIHRILSHASIGLIVPGKLLGLWIPAARLKQIGPCSRSLGAGRGGRTLTPLRAADFKSAASADSAIPAAL